MLRTQFVQSLLEKHLKKKGILSNTLCLSNCSVRTGAYTLLKVQQIAVTVSFVLQDNKVKFKIITQKYEHTPKAGSRRTDKIRDNLAYFSIKTRCGYSLELPR